MKQKTLQRVFSVIALAGVAGVMSVGDANAHDHTQCGCEHNDSDCPYPEEDYQKYCGTSSCDARDGCCLDGSGNFTCC
jgi:hypothetical protein